MAASLYAHHAREPDRIHREIEVGGRELFQQVTRLVDAVSFGVGQSQGRHEGGEPGIVGRRLCR